jgi:hypothetical protein
MPIFKANNLPVLIEQPESGECEFLADGQLLVTRVFKTLNYENAYNDAPRPGDPDPHGLAARCFDTKIERIAAGLDAAGNEVPAWCKITSQYLGYLYMPPARVELISARMDRPIEQHPDFNDTSKFGRYAGDPGDAPITKMREWSQMGGWSFKQFYVTDSTQWAAKPPTKPDMPGEWIQCNVSGKFRGIDSYMVPTWHWRVTDYLLLPDSPNRLFKLDTPPSVLIWDTYVSPPGTGNNKYLKVQHDVVNILKGRAVLWERTRSWLYFDVGWMPEIYG